MRLRLLVLRSLLVAASALAADTFAAEGPAGDTAEVLVTVDGRPITRGDLEFRFAARNVADEDRAGERQAILERLVDERLMQAFLEGRNAVATKDAIDAEIERLHESIRLRGQDPREVLARSGYSDAVLRRELALPIAWRSYARAAITPDQLRQYFEKHRRRFDGTELRASQIFSKATTDPEREAAARKLAAIRKQIADGQSTFADAARRHSEAPTAAAGGDVGFFPYRGKMPEAFTRQAFRLERGEIGGPFSTSYGVHLVSITDVRPGQLSLEDVRNEVFEAFAGELWTQIVKQERAKAKIEWAQAARPQVKPSPSPR
ncbi:MAG: peptidylprolyl isomerase [Planctomycetales bacterium]